MARYADVDYLIEELKKNNKGSDFTDYNWNTEMLCGLLDHCPKANVRKDLQAKWVHTTDDEGNHYFHCSYCLTGVGYTLPACTEYEIPYPRIPYCSRCGAKMR